MALLATRCQEDLTLLRVALWPKLIRELKLGGITMQSVKVHLDVSAFRYAFAITQFHINYTLAVVDNRHGWIESHSLHHATLQVLELHLFNIYRLAQLTGSLNFDEITLLKAISSLGALDLC